MLVMMMKMMALIAMITSTMGVISVVSIFHVPFKLLFGLCENAKVTAPMFVNYANSPWVLLISKIQRRVEEYLLPGDGGDISIANRKRKLCFWSYSESKYSGKCKYRLIKANLHPRWLRESALKFITLLIHASKFFRR